MSKKEDVRKPPRAEKVREAKSDKGAAYKRHLEQNPGSDYDEATNSARPAVSGYNPYGKPQDRSEAEIAKFVRVPDSKTIKTEGPDKVGGNSRPRMHTRLLPNKGPHSNPECYTGLGSTQQPALDGQKVRYDDKAEPATGTKDLEKKKKRDNAAVRQEPTVTSVRKLGITKNASKTLPNDGINHEDCDE